MQRSFTLVLLFVVCFVMMVGPLAAQDSRLPVLTPVEANPVLVADPSISWEAGGAIPLEILPYEDGWIMFYLGGNADQTTWSVGYAISEDGLNWTRSEGNPVFVLDPALGPYGVTDFSVFTTGEQWVMLFVAAGNTRVQGIKVATAPSPEGPWTIADDLALPAPRIMEWDGMGIAAQMVTRAGDAYVMYFGSDGAIGRATSPDGFDWTLYDDSETTRTRFASSDPVFTANPDSGTWDQSYVYGSLVLPTADGWQMFYAGGNGNGHDAIGYATSPDGILWTRQGTGPVLSDPQMYPFAPMGVIETDTGSVLYYFSGPDSNPAHWTVNAATISYP